MLSTFLIALREGLEAALIVGILVAYLVKTGRNHLLAPLWLGVSVALLASLGLGGFLSFTSAELSARGEEFFAGTTSFLAVGFVTWMVFWMKRAARGLREELHGKVDSAVGTGSLAIAVTAFVAVVREGLETALFIYANFKTVGAASSATIGLVLGLALAVALGYLIYNRAVRINLGKFFQITGTALVVVAAGVLSYGIHEYQELGWLPGVDSFIWDVTSWMAKDSIVATVLAGSIGFDTTTSWLQFLVAGVYLGFVLWLYLRPARAPKKELISA
ncbi:MAG: iron transporter [Actinobacteria bacterium]|jgi:high-affinity iron transporter|nr:iron transporter [Actinomycetota bacterium]NDA94749.1 iron transporter [Actinomycetota bacterium]NDH80839.1 iron transporter [Actinomycetota bacterium]NDH99022.1 iron transporter [Actinomycetota bacterium]NDI07866.1 iron transporter [Actinomycetota bacterium]